MLFLLSGVYLTYRIRNAKKEVYQEKVTLSIGIILETAVSFLTYLVKHSFWSHPDLHPDHILLLYLIRCHTTVTTMILILFFPKVSLKDEQTQALLKVHSSFDRYSTVRQSARRTIAPATCRRRKYRIHYLTQATYTRPYSPMGKSILEKSI